MVAEVTMSASPRAAAKSSATAMSRPSALAASASAAARAAVRFHTRTVSKPGNRAR